MFYSFAEELNLFYLQAFGIDATPELYLEVKEDLMDSISKIRDSIIKGLRTLECKDHPTNWDFRHKTYEIICNHFFSYNYTRYWNFNGNGAAMPVILSRLSKEIFCSENAGKLSEVYYMYMENHPELTEKFKDKSKEFIETMDVQARQYIFVYCYEHGVNFGYY